MSETKNETPGDDRPDLNESTTAGVGDVGDPALNYKSVRIGIEVHAGLLPGTPEAEFSRQWFITSDVWQRMKDGDGDARNEVIRIAGESREYAATLENPGRFNWVRRDWVYF